MVVGTHSVWLHTRVEEGKRLSVKQSLQKELQFPKCPLEAPAVSPCVKGSHEANMLTVFGVWMFWDQFKFLVKLKFRGVAYLNDRWLYLNVWVVHVFGQIIKTTQSYGCCAVYRSLSSRCAEWTLGFGVVVMEHWWACVCAPRAPCSKLALADNLVLLLVQLWSF